MLKYAKLFFMALVLAGCSQEVEQKPTSPLIITTSSGQIRYQVEVAKTPAEMQTGLMHRTNLGLTNGMIFNVYPVRPIAMWMKNTKIPLDMLFIAPNGTISMIKENAEPMSEELIISEEPVRAVVEINGGQVKVHNIKVGDKVTHTLLTSMLDTRTIGKGGIAPQDANAPQLDIPQGKIIPKTGKIVPKTGAIVPKTGAIQPKTGAIVPKTGKVVPKTGAAAPGQQVGPIKLPTPAP